MNNNVNERCSTHGSADSHKTSVDHLMGDLEANAPRWTWVIGYWPWYMGHLSLDLLIIETSVLTSQSTYWDTVLQIQGGYKSLHTTSPGV